MENLKKLKDLLNIENFKDCQEEEVQKKFKDIAIELLNNYCIRKGDKITYDITDIEFYFYSKNHKDMITYPRKANRGDWFFHNSGVDICFGGNKVKKIDSDESMKVQTEDAFGGILIRGLRRNDGKSFRGPLKCCNELFDQFSAFADSKNKFIYPYLNNRNEQPMWGDKKGSIDKCSRYFKFKNNEADRTKKFDLIIKENYEAVKAELNDTLFLDFLNRKYRFFITQEFEHITTSTYAAVPKVENKQDNRDGRF